MYVYGFLKNSTNSYTSTLASLRPATSANVTCLGVLGLESGISQVTNTDPLAALFVVTVGATPEGFGFRVSGFGFRVSGFGLKVQGAGLRDWGVGFGV